MTDKTEMIDGSPTKRFFIDIITKDISLTAAILDLVDNSVDSARTLASDRSMDGITVSIAATPSGFSIEDNCAGITLVKARSYVFRMGRPLEVAPTADSIGQFGVGMKRALFKLGSAFAVESTSGSDSFTVDVDVATWSLDEKSWELPMSVHSPPASESSGTTIIVNNLHEPVKAAFNDSAFLTQLKDELRSRHRLAMGNGLRIVLNGEVLSAEDSTVAVSDLLKPAVRRFTVITPEYGEVSVEIIAGIAPDNLMEVEEDAEPEAQARAAADAGWLVFGNGRLLLANDKGRLTGWGSGRRRIPQYHNQYARFRGFVYMTATNAGAIPWNTTKTSVDSDSPIWAAVLAQMIEAGRSIIDLLNMAKFERQIATHGMATPISDAIRGASAVDAASVITVHFSMSITELRGDFSVDAMYPAPNPELAETWKKIQYSVLSRSFDELATAVGTSSAAEIGRQSFDAYHEANVGT